MKLGGDLAGMGGAKAKPAFPQAVREVEGGKHMRPPEPAAGAEPALKEVI